MHRLKFNILWLFGFGTVLTTCGCYAEYFDAGLVRSPKYFDAKKDLGAGISDCKVFV